MADSCRSCDPSLECELFKSPPLVSSRGAVWTWLALDSKESLFSKFPGKTKPEGKAIKMDEKLSLKKSFAELA